MKRPRTFNYTHHRLDLFSVIGRLCDHRHDHQQTMGINRRLGVVRLFEATGRYLHDP